jgi:hypothetical protein
MPYPSWVLVHLERTNTHGCKKETPIVMRVCGRAQIVEGPGQEDYTSFDFITMRCLTKVMIEALA